MKKSIILYALLYATSLGSYAQIASITKFTPCVCEQAETKRDLSKGFLPSCNQLKDITKWNAWGKEINCDKIFYANLKTNISAKNDAAFYGFSIIAFQPLRITIPDFTINLTPCNVSTPELGVRIMKQHKIKQYKASFDYENFDRTAKSYLDILMLISGVAEKDFLTVFLSNHFVGKNNITEFIHSINDRYNIAIPTNIPGKFPYNSWETNAITIVDTLYNNNVSLKEFILNEFVLAEDDANGTSHILTPDEGENLENLFVKWLGYFSINDIDNQIYPQMKVNFGTNVIGIEISTDIIQRW